MVDTTVLLEAEKLIRETTEEFLIRVKKYRQDSWFDNIKKGYLDFSIFFPLNDEYSELKHFEKKLVDNIREDLVLGIFEKLFHLHSIQVEYPNQKVIIGESNSRRVTRMSNEDFPFEFIIDFDGVRTGYLFDFPLEVEYEEEKYFELIKHQYDLNQFEILVFNKNAQIERKNKYISKNLKSFEKYISLESFFKKHFSKEEYDLYLTLVRETVCQANEEIGLRTIRTMSGRNLSNFKVLLLPQFASLPYQSMSYFFDKQSTPKMFISENDYDILNKTFVSEKLYKAFFGNEDFAKCFITSEYLYYALGENELFDYTSVICGYTKSVEQLIFKLVQINLETKNSTDVLWIKANIPYKFRNEHLPTRPNPITNKTQIQFSSTYQRFFDTTLSPMIWFLYDNVNGWNVSNEAREYIKRCLDDYVKSCRNEHFHKDNIYDYSTVTRIRNNTILIFYYLLGGYKLTNDIERNHMLLGIESDSFDRLYKQINKIPSSVKRFILRFGNQDINAVRLFNQEFAKYDENGSLKKSAIYFYPIDKFGEDDYDYACYNPKSSTLLIIDKDNLPEKVWWYDINKNKRHLVEW